MKRPSIRNQYPRDMVKPEEMKNDVNTMRSINFLKDDDIADDVD